MSFCLAKTLRFWVGCEYEQRNLGGENRAKTELIAEILRKHEEEGHAMRYLNSRGQIAWKATSLMLSKLADLQRDVDEDLADWP